MGGAPRFAIAGAITDHTAHHRGALTVYARLNQMTPPDPCCDMKSWPARKHRDGDKPAVR